MKLNAKLLLGLAAAAAMGLSAPMLSAQDAAPKSIKIGYAISKTGPNAGGANITQIPNYQLWVQEVNAKGGLMLKQYGKRIPIEVIEYDDRSNSEEAVRAVERLIEQDKVDLLLPPWGTGINLASARPSTSTATRSSPSVPSPTARRNSPSAGRTASGSSAPRSSTSTHWSICSSSSARKARSTTRSRWSRLRRIRHRSLEGRACGLREGGLQACI